MLYVFFDVKSLFFQLIDLGTSRSWLRSIDHGRKHMFRNQYCENRLNMYREISLLVISYFSNGCHGNRPFSKNPQWCQLGITRILDVEGPGMHNLQKPIVGTLVQGWSKNPGLAAGLLDNIESVTVIDEYICSDHLPHRVVIRCDLATNHHCVSGRNKNDFIDWKTAGVHDYDKFDGKSSEYLSNVDVSVSIFNCTDQSYKLHEGEIDRLYGSIIKSLNMAANDCIPRRKSGTCQQIAGWTEIVKESHDVARSDFKFWCSNGKPRHGYVYEAMRRSRSQFNYALRQCKRSEDTIKADRLAGDLLQHNVVDFWKMWETLPATKRRTVLVLMRLWVSRI